jgi:hypothetical protein
VQSFFTNLRVTSILGFWFFLLSFVLFHISDIHSRVLLYFHKCVKHSVFLNAVGLLSLRFSWIIRYDLFVAINDSMCSLFVI